MLDELGAAVVDTSWGIGGSQEVETIALTLDGKTLTVEAETYIGLSITGEPELVERIAGEVRARTDAGRGIRTERVGAVRKAFSLGGERVGGACPKCELGSSGRMRILNCHFRILT